MTDVIDNAMLAQVGVTPVVGRLIATIIKEGALIGRDIVTWNAGHSRFTSGGEKRCLVYLQSGRKDFRYQLW